MPDGKLFVGRETWLQVPPFDGELLSDDPGELVAMLGVDGFVPDLLPGRYVAGRKIASVDYAIGERGLRAVVRGWHGPSQGDAVEGTRATIQQTMTVGPDGALYPARVDAQHGDGSLDCTPQFALAPEARTLPALTSVPMRAIAPGVTATVPAGSVVLVGFESGRADRPYASLWDAGASNLTGLKLGVNATKGAVRVDDPVDSGMLAFSQGISPNILQITYTPPGGSPQVTNITMGFAAGAVVVGVAPGGGATISGKPTAGSALTLIE
jgi:hypothetical protein